MKKNYFGVCLMTILCLGMASCSSDDNDEMNIDVTVKPAGNWIGTTDATNCELQFITEHVGDKDSSMCTFVVEDVKNDTVYTLKGGVVSFRSPVTAIAFAKTEEGPDSARLTYVGNTLRVNFVGGSKTWNAYNLTKNYYSLYTIGGDWQSDSCQAHFIVGSKAYKGSISIVNKTATTIYKGTYQYIRNTSKGTFVSDDKQTTMSLRLTTDSKTNVPTLTVVKGDSTYVMNRK